MPQGVPQVLSWARGGVDHLNGQTRVALSPGGGVGPVGLGDLLPGGSVEPGAGLVAKHEACVVVISVRVYEEGSAEVHCVELIVT